MKKLKLGLLEKWHDANRVQGLENRRLGLEELLPHLERLPSLYQVSILGSSYEGRPIHRVAIGKGSRHVLMWTQMHGNESTGTRAVLDLLEWLGGTSGKGSFQDLFLSNCTIVIIPMLNPDGAERYTRENAQGIDLNRDVLDKKAPESILLQEELARTKPDYCFNLHDQRTIFSVGSPPQTATLSFLAPSEDQARTITPGRIKTMELISSVYDLMKEVLPSRIGRYTDEFYPTATGDNFQRMGYPTVLIESGHFPGDYSRTVSRKMTFLSLVGALYHMCRDAVADHSVYFQIPENEKRYLDVIVKNVTIDEKLSDLGIYLKEEFRGEQVSYVPKIDKFEDLSAYSADRIIPGAHLSFGSVQDAEKWVQIEFN